MTRTAPFTREQLATLVWVPAEGFIPFVDMTVDQHRAVIDAMEAQSADSRRWDLEALRACVSMEFFGTTPEDIRDWVLFQQSVEL
jgi:hypothetical protein